MALWGQGATLLGSIVAAAGVFVSKKTADKVGGGAFGGNFELPKALVRQSRLAAIGLLFVALGTCLQMVATYISQV